MSDEIYCALLRGINVGGKNKLPMKALIKLFDAAGCTDIATYIQSGNVVFKTKDALAKKLPARITSDIGEAFGYKIPIIVRSQRDLEKIIASNPFAASCDDKTLHVAFLAEQPSKSCLRQLDPNRSPPDKFVISKREIYLHCPNGLARTKLTNAYFDMTLDTVSTMRNWKTVGKLLQMMRSL